jgi:hypothetical protein
MNPYYYVYNQQGGAPRVRHDTAQKAMNEAERLAAKQPGQAFEVLKCVAISQTQKASTFWMDGEEPAKEPEWRLLYQGEIIEDGDEIESNGSWRPVSWLVIGLSSNDPSIKLRRRVK